MRIEPPPSEPVAAETIPAATAAAEPPEEPPVVRSGFHGLRVIPLASVAVQGKIISSGTLVIPTGIAPAARRRRTTSAVCGGRRAVAARSPGGDLAGEGDVVLDGHRDPGQRPVGALGPVGLGQRLLGQNTRNAFSVGLSASIRRR